MVHAYLKVRTIPVLQRLTSGSIISYVPWDVGYEEIPCVSCDPQRGVRRYIIGSILVAG